MCVLYVSFGSKVRTRTFECVVMGKCSIVYFEIQVALILCRVLYLLAALVHVCVDIMVMSSAQAMT